jgi:hypothetical protein
MVNTNTIRSKVKEAWKVLLDMFFFFLRESALLILFIGMMNYIPFKLYVL